MIIRRCDRYVVSEMIGPFLISLFGLLLFILLNQIVLLSNLIVDRGVGVVTLARLLLFKTPSMLVVAFPVSGLFTTFLGLGRLVHDREIMALEAAGISLRRILAPLLVAAVLIGGIDFAFYNWVIPFSEHAYQRTLRGIIFRQGVPHIQANTFFKGPEGQFFYVRRYDEQDGTLRGVLVYDIEGKVFPLAEAAVTIITAEEGCWESSAWNLQEGRVYGYNQEGALIYTGTFGQLRVAVDRSVADFVLGSRTPAEMGIGELRHRIALLRESGLAANDLIVECHSKVAIPLATLVFVLFGGAASLIFGWRSRAVGVVVSFLLVGLFQGVLLWAQTLGRRGIISPSFAAWIPDLLFGLIGIFLFLRLDRLSHRDLWARIRHAIPFVGVLLVVGVLVMGEEIPVEIDCEELFVSADHRQVYAQGGVHLSYGETLLLADRVTLDEDDDGFWRLHATGDIDLTIGEDFTLSGDELLTILALEEGSLVARKATAACFRGRSSFNNSKGEKNLLLYKGEDGLIRFDSKGEISVIEVDNGELTTCNCCGGVLRSQPYSIETGKLLLYPNRLVVAFDLTVRSFGYPVFWLPVYVQPLDETLESPLFPAIGTSALRGWFLKWNLPFYLDEENYGAILFDYFSRFQEVGLGAVLRYSLALHQGRARFYYFPAKIGDRIAEVYLDHTVAFAEGWAMRGGLAYREVGKRCDLSFAFSLDGKLENWQLALSAERSRKEGEEEVHTTERLPEFVLTRSQVDVGPLSLFPRVGVGWFREWKGEGETETLVNESLRFDGSLDVGLAPIPFLGFSLTPKAGLRLTRYEESGGSKSRESLSFSASLDYPGMSLSYTYLQINGRSPFDFDRLVSTNSLSWRFTANGDLSVWLDGGVDLVSGTFTPLLVTTSWNGWASLTLVTSYDLTTAVVEKLNLSGRWESEGSGFSWEIPYCPPTTRFEPLSFQVYARREVGRVSIQGEIDLEQERLTKGALQAEFCLESGWGINLSGRYEQGKGEILDPGFGLFRDLYDCLRIGIERQSGQIWVYTSILAFPEAILRYAPTEASLKVGI